MGGRWWRARVPTVIVSEMALQKAPKPVWWCGAGACADAGAGAEAVAGEGAGASPVGLAGGEPLARSMAQGAASESRAAAVGGALPPRPTSALALHKLAASPLPAPTCLLSLRSGITCNPQQ